MRTGITTQNSRESSAHFTDGLPRRSPVKLRWFTWYSRRYVCRHFNSFRVSKAQSAPQESDRPLVIYLNHASWWDPLVCLTLTDLLFPGRAAFAPMDAEQLQSYPIFRGLGFFGVKQRSTAGAADFLRIAGRILARSHVLWMTPQGRFCDVRERPVRLAGGLAHLALRHPEARFVPLAIEYPFWHDKNPEVLVRWGRAVDLGQAVGRKVAEVEPLLAAALEHTQDLLADESLRRDPVHFDSLIWGRAGVGGVYDQFRRVASWLKGKSFNPRHNLAPGFSHPNTPHAPRATTTS